MIYPNWWVQRAHVTYIHEWHECATWAIYQEWQTTLRISRCCRLNFHWNHLIYTVLVQTYPKHCAILRKVKSFLSISDIWSLVTHVFLFWSLPKVVLKRRQMCTAACAKILRRYNEMRLTSNDQRRHPSPTPKYRGSGLKRLSCWLIWFECSVHVSDGYPKKVWMGVDGWGELYPIFFWFF